MKFSFLCRLTLPVLSLGGLLLFSSCTVDQEAALFSQGAASSEKKKEKTTKVKTDSSESWAEKMKAAREEREKERAESEKKKAQELAAKKKKDEAEARKLAYEKKKEEAAQKALAQKEAREKAAAEAEKKALAEKKAKEAAKADAEKALLAEKKAAEKAAEKKAREDKYAAEKKRREEERQARIAARKKVEESRASGSRGNEVAAVANRSGGGFFSSLAVSTPKQYKSKGHHVEINNRALSSLNSSNAKIEISLGQQRARIYNTSGGMKQLVIETQISSGKSGHTTPTGSFRIKEKLEHKRSTLYGRWVNSSGQTVQSSGDSRKRPSGGSTFVGAEMPNWLRITGGIGMHIGYVPNGPASHGCIRVPAAVQPLIFSKVGVGTPVTITY